MIHKMAGINRGKSVPVLVEGSEKRVSSKEKADLLVRTYQRVHSVSNVGRERQLRGGQMLEQEGHKVGVNTDNSDVANVFFLLCRRSSGK